MTIQSDRIDEIKHLKEVIDNERKHFDELNREKNSLMDKLAKIKGYIESYDNPNEIIHNIKRNWRKNEI